MPILGYNYLFQMTKTGFAVLGLSQDGACTDLFGNLSENSLKGDLSNDNIVHPPLFSLFNTFNYADFWLQPTSVILSQKVSLLFISTVLRRQQ
jgi:hypothetical protein